MLKIKRPSVIVWFSAYGGIFSREITDEYIVDTGHLVAYEPTINIRVGLAGGIFSSFFGGEGLVTKVRGPGRIYMQSLLHHLALPVVCGLNRTPHLECLK